MAKRETSKDLGVRIVAAAHAAYSIVREAATSLPARPRASFSGPGGEEMGDLDDLIRAAESLAHACPGCIGDGHRTTYLPCALTPLQGVVRRFSDDVSRRWLSAGCMDRIRDLAVVVQTLADDVKAGATPKEAAATVERLNREEVPRG